MLSNDDLGLNYWKEGRLVVRTCHDSKGRGHLLVSNVIFFHPKYFFEDRRQASHRVQGICVYQMHQTFFIIRNRDVSCFIVLNWDIQTIIISAAGDFRVMS